MGRKCVCLRRCSNDPCQWRLAPGAATGQHVHEMDYVIVPMTDSEMTVVSPRDERSKAPMVRGKSYFRKAGVAHDVVNETESEIVFLEIELKAPRMIRRNWSAA